MKAQVESLNPVKRRIFIEVDKQEVAEEKAKIVAQIRRQAALPGFRKGKAPVNLIVRRFSDRIESDVHGNLIKRTYGEALRQESIYPVSDADIQIDQDNADGGFSYTVVVEVPPEVKPAGYTGLQLEKESTVVEDWEIEKELEAAQKQNTIYEPAPEGSKAESGDMINIDYEGTIEGESFEGGSSKGADIVIGSERALREMEEGLIGASEGDKIELEAVISADVPNEKIAGKTASFKVVVNSIKNPKPPVLDDEFAKEISKAGSMDELRTKIREMLETNKKETARRKFVSSLQDAVLEANPFEVPQCLVADELAHRLQNFKETMRRRGVNPDALNLENPEIQSSQREASEKAIRWVYLVDAIAKAENLEVSDEDLDAKIQEISDAENLPASKVRSILSENGGLNSVKRSLLEQKTIEFIEKNSTINEA